MPNMNTLLERKEILSLAKAKTRTNVTKCGIPILCASLFIVWFFGLTF